MKQTIYVLFMLLFCNVVYGQSVGSVGPTSVKVVDKDNFPLSNISVNVLISGTKTQNQGFPPKPREVTVLKEMIIMTTDQNGRAVIPSTSSYSYIKNASVSVGVGLLADCRKTSQQNMVPRGMINYAFKAMNCFPNVSAYCATANPEIPIELFAKRLNELKMNGQDIVFKSSGSKAEIIDEYENNTLATIKKNGCVPIFRGQFKF